VRTTALLAAVAVSLSAASSGSLSASGPAATNGLIAYTVLFRVPGEKSSADYIYGLCIRDLRGSSRRLTAVRLRADESAAWSPDGRRLAFDRTDERRGTSAIMVMDAKGSIRSLSGDFTADSQPTWSPDGSKIAFVQKPGDLYVMNADGTNRRLLVPHPTQNVYGPRWSPDGEHIAFTRGISVGLTRSEVRIVDADGTGERELAKGAAPSWAPDGRRLAFDGPSDDAAFVFSIGIDGRNRRRLSTGYAPVWSPDGARILFSRERLRANGETATDFYVMAPNGSGVRPVLRSPLWEFDPAWQPKPYRSGVFAIRGGPPCAVAGSERPDTLRGSRYRDFVYGFGGGDVIRGGPGDDVVSGEDGPDVLRGGPGADRIGGGHEEDRIDGGRGNDAVFAGSWNDVVSGGEGSDRLFGGLGRDRIFGGSGDDTIGAVDGGTDRISCGSGNDVARLDRLDHAATDCEEVERY
jgi:dipeptidyl aminopeptidase/acylaminoacyl peptidase